MKEIKYQNEFSFIFFGGKKATDIMLKQHLKTFFYLEF